MKIRLHLAKCKHNRKNCLYPKQVVCSSPEELQKALKYDHVCCDYKNNRRSSKNFLRSTLVIMDCDNNNSDDPNDWITPDDIKTEFSDVSYILVPSRHNMKIKDGKSARPRFHIMFPIAEITDAEEYKNLKLKIYEAYPFFDEQALDAARFFFASDVEVSEIDWHEGLNMIDQEIGFGAAEDDTIPEGQRNSTLYNYGTRIIKRLGDTQEAHDAFIAESRKCDPPLADTELKSIWRSVQKFFHQEISSQPGYVPPDQYQNHVQSTGNALTQGGPQTRNVSVSPTQPPAPPTGPFGKPPSPPAPVTGSSGGSQKPGYLKPGDYSDIGQATVFAATYKDSVAYTPGTGYLVYNSVFWSDYAEQDTAKAEEFMELQLDDAAKLVSDYTKALKREKVPIPTKNTNPPASLTKKQKRLYTGCQIAIEYYNFVAKRREMRFIKSLLAAARPKLQIPVESLDSDPHLLNTPSATYRLDDGLAGKRPHNADDLITKVTAVDPSDKGRDIWLDALKKIFCGDQELIDYVQKIMGLAVIGRVNLEALIIAYGGGSNGKSTFFNTIKRILGTYAGTISSDVLLKTNRNVMPAIAELRGKRFVIAAELGEDAKLSSEMAKKLCSTDDITAEKKYFAPFDFTPSHMIVLYTNNLPQVEARDNGTWRRLLVIPFNADFTGDDDIKHYADYLVENTGEAVLAWLIEGAKLVIADGYDPPRPQIVIDACDKYRKDSDWLSAFIDECCDIDPQATVKAGALQQEFRTYCLRTFGEAKSASVFSQALESAGYKKKRDRNGNVILGIKIKDDDDDAFLD